MNEEIAKKEVVVIADDDPTIRKVMKAALEKGGFEVVDVDIDYAVVDPVEGNANIDGARVVLITSE